MTAPVPVTFPVAVTEINAPGPAFTGWFSVTTLPVSRLVPPPELRPAALRLFGVVRFRFPPDVARTFVVLPNVMVEDGAPPWAVKVAEDPKSVGRVNVPPNVTSSVPLIVPDTVVRSASQAYSALWLHRIACRTARDHAPRERPLYSQRPKRSPPESVLGAIPDISTASARCLSRTPRPRWRRCAASAP